MGSMSLMQPDIEALNALCRSSFHWPLVSKPEINKWGSFTIYILYKKKWAESKELSEMKIYTVSYYSFLEGRKHSFRWEKVI